MNIKNNFVGLNKCWLAAKKRVFKELEDFFNKNPGKIIELYRFPHPCNIQYIYKDLHGLVFALKINEDESIIREPDNITLFQITVLLTDGFYDIIDMPDEGVGRINTNTVTEPKYAYYTINEYDYGRENTKAELYTKMVHHLGNLIIRYGLMSDGPVCGSARFKYIFKTPVKVRCILPDNILKEMKVSWLSVTTRNGYSYVIDTITMYSYCAGLFHIDSVLLNRKDLDNLIGLVK